jgi:drug/metabolite transporter (DMT)-like permease
MVRDSHPFRIKADLILVLVAMLWGGAFVVQRAVSNQIGVFTFNAARFLLASLILWGAMVIARSFRLHQRNQVAYSTPEGIQIRITRRKFIYLTLAGILLFSASYFQQAGLRYTTAGNAGFITSLYVVLVPILLWIFWHNKIPPITWVGAFIALAGSLLLSTGGRWDLSNGDVLVLIGVLFWGLHVILVGKVSWSINTLSFALGQYFVAGVLNMAFALQFEGTDLKGLSDAGWGIVYTGIFSIALGYTLQIFAQKYSPVADTAIILSMEAVFAAFFGLIFLGEFFTNRQIIGCVLILIAIIITAGRTNKRVEIDNIELRNVKVTPER